MRLRTLCRLACLVGLIMLAACQARDTLQTHVAYTPANWPKGTIPRFPSLNEYSNQILNRIVRNMRYPPAAFDAGQQGSAIAEALISRDGKLLDVKLLKATGYPALDAEAIDVFRRIAVFPPFPDDTSPEVETAKVQLPINFALN